MSDTNKKVKKMDHRQFLCRILWKFQSQNLFTDVTIICSDGEVSAHRAMLVGFLKLWGICLDESIKCLLVPDVFASDVKSALKSFYLDFDVSNLFNIFVNVKAEPSEESKPNREEASCDEIYSGVMVGNEAFDDSDQFETIKEDPFDIDKTISNEASSLNESNNHESVNLKLKLRKGRPRGKKDKCKRKISSFECLDCDLDIKGRLNYKKHLRNHHGLQEAKRAPENVPTYCPYCEKVLANVINFRVHVVLLHREKADLHPEIVFQKPCEKCEEKFFNILDLNHHSKAVHGLDIQTHKCRICKEIVLKSKLRAHRAMLHKDQLSQLPGFVKNIPCPYCTKLVNMKSGLHSHIARLHVDKLGDHPEIKFKFSCEPCGDNFYSHSNLQNHNAVHHGEEFQCNLCDKHFKNISSRASHIENHHRNEQHLCEQCSKVFKTTSALRIHIRKVHSSKPFFKFPCSQCSQGSMTEEGLQNHKETKHGEKKVMCSYCPTTFHDNSGRKLHESRMHQEKTVPCDQCDKKFADKSFLTLHIRNVHIHKKDKVCPICGEEFWDGNTFKCHVNRHNDYKPYSCEVCGNCYYTDRDVKKHLKTHTLPHPCNLCEKSFATKGILADHVRKHAGERLDCRHTCGSNYLDRRNRDRHERSCSRNPHKGASWSAVNKSS